MSGWVKLSCVLGHSCNHHGCLGFTWALPGEESLSFALAFMVNVIPVILGYIYNTIFRYLLEVITFIAVVMLSMVYTETFYLLPLLIKTILTLFTWFSVKNIYRNCFGSFYTKDTTDFVYWGVISGIIYFLMWKEEVEHFLLDKVLTKGLSYTCVSAVHI